VALKAGLLEATLRERVARIHERIQIRGIGMIWGIDLGLIDPGMADRVSDRCYERGLIVETVGRHDAVLKLIPPLTVEPEVLERGCVIIEESIRDELQTLD
jgi:diaminobutyrate-2-oxoglutarate transaminase